MEQQGGKPGSVEDGARPADEPPAAAPDLAAVVDAVAHRLPAQGPIGEFIHHNPLHAFEELPFEEAVAVAGRELGREPFLPEARYRAELAAGRIAERDLEAVLVDGLGSRAEETVGGVLRRLDLHRRVIEHGIPEAQGVALGWLLGETPVLDRFRPDLPREVREATSSTRGVLEIDDADEARAVRALWQACVEATRRSPLAPPPPARALCRHRDRLLAACDVDTDEQVHPVLIRFTGAYLDQGFAHWAMPLRGRGMHACFLATYGASAALPPWRAELVRLIAEDQRHARDGLASLRASLEALGVPAGEWSAYLSASALALRGWAGMVRQIEERPDRVPARPIPATLVDFLAVRLLLERAALHAASREPGLEVPLSALREALSARIATAPAPNVEDQAWPLFHLAQLAGLDADAVIRLRPVEVEALQRELAELDSITRRRVLHLAYERHLRHRFYDALDAHRPAPAGPAPDYQAVFCLDDREESFRRQLEEIDPTVETFGAAGFFGIAMYYQGATDAHPRTLCPVAIRPKHYVAEAHRDGTGLAARWQQLLDRSGGLVDMNVHLSSRTLVRGTILMTVLGVLSILPLVLRVVLPWLGRRLAGLELGRERRTHMRIERQAGAPPIGEQAGFTVEEMARIVRGLLRTMGVADRLAPLVLVLGHGSTSLNNPHRAAYDCGACGGGHGGPNARAFAVMANDPRVRGLLAEQGLSIAPDTWFVGGERNSASNAVTFFDEDRLPAEVRPRLQRARAAIDVARQREAHERCRRFAAVPSWFPPRAALLHVEARSADLAQTRPELGHATNAFCVVGRRARTKGLFLDRRAFLVSYDPARDADGSLLSDLLAAAVPVMAGINLEYCFGTIDPTGYGCGTKLPHNVASLLGVMDGAESDLRTGLPWQMVEIHEPVRLTLVVDTSRDTLLRVLRQSPAVWRLVENRWLFVACLDDGLWGLRAGGFVRYAREHPTPAALDWVSWYRGKRGHLAFARLGTAPVAVSPLP